MWLTKIPIIKNDFREQKYNNFLLGQGVRLILRFGVQVALTILIWAYSLLV